MLAFSSVCPIAFILKKKKTAVATVIAHGCSVTVSSASQQNDGWLDTSAAPCALCPTPPHAPNTAQTEIQLQLEVAIMFKNSSPKAQPSLTAICLLSVSPLLWWRSNEKLRQA